MNGGMDGGMDEWIDGGMVNIWMHRLMDAFIHPSIHPFLNAHCITVESSYKYSIISVPQTLIIINVLLCPRIDFHTKKTLLSEEDLKSKQKHKHVSIL